MNNPPQPAVLDPLATANPRPIVDIAARLGLAPDEIEPYGRFKAKLPLDRIDLVRAARSKLILVSAVTPTPAGEGKTTTSIGLADGLSRLGKRAVAVLREPSLGPVFGMKGGATGGGRARLMPHADINLHFNGDFSAVEKAHNLLAAVIDNHVHSKKSTLDLDPLTIRWKRVVDMNDRSLRKIVIGLGGPGQGIPRESGFDITAASEVMAILCLAQSAADLKERLGKIFIGFSRSKAPIFARDLKVAGAMLALLREAMQPNLVQTLEGTPAILHGGPFGNIAQGTNSVVATQLGMSLADWVVTEAGFGFDLGGEKFLDLKCRASGLWPDAVVLVATIRALKYQGGVPVKELTVPNTEAIRRGFANLTRHLENVRFFGLAPVVVINRFAADSDDEMALVRELCAERGATAVPSDHFGHGGEGAIAAAEAVIAVAEASTRAPKYAYALNSPVEAKIEAVAQVLYGAGEVIYAPKARTDLKTITDLGLANLPICMAKTQYSFSEQPGLLGRPEGFKFAVREIEIAAGAGFIIPICGDIMRMPGLPDVPAAEHIDLDEHGEVIGLM
ncbi:MAG: formate--tetrahydrofolate ligase [Deltaproteobacteria bacterium]|nr:MAG: formate--tetrahydrofolate ligase [Deltaproteobacteria bacterium]